MIKKAIDWYLSYQNTLRDYGVEKVDEIISFWRQSHRYFHSERHLRYLVEEIERIYGQGEIKADEKDSLIVTAFFHDLVYDPTRTDNEEQSAEMLSKFAKPNHPKVDYIRDIILDTKSHIPKSNLSKIFCDIDMHIVTKSDFTELLEWEMQIFKEYQYLDYQYYKIARLNLLRKIAEQYPENNINLGHLIDYVEKHKPKIGIYPGSFNPFHLGHQNILDKAEKIFDKVIIAQGINPDKSESERNIQKPEVLKFKQVESFSGFLTEYISTKETYADVTLIRGLRSGIDLDYEVNQLRFMEEMKADLQVIFIICDKQYEHISSSSIKNLEKISAGSGRKYLP
jgi:pantetheine-phosphate adenylyltransferase